MTNDGHILLPIDLHQIGRDKLENVMRIARSLERGVLGLMLEDLQLQQVADLPFTTEITLSGARERSLLRDHLSQRCHRINAGTRQLLLELAGSNEVELSFEEASGHRLHCALERNGGQDIFFPPRHQRQHPRQARHRTRFAIERLGLVLPSREQGQRVMTIAASLLRAGLVGQVHAVAGGDVSITELAALPLQGHRLVVRTDLELTSDNILLLIRRSPYDLMLIPRGCLEPVAPGELDAALALASGQVMVVGAG
ncbi:hypothetical protein [Pseudohalioglobus lutimaris]|nr:hypothetical protein [Pseudohalioglobus lutimaris]